jgi:RNase P subunit RPR2
MIKMQKNQIQKIALERIYRLSELIREEKNKELRLRWIKLMKLISMRNRARIPKELKEEFREEFRKLKEN